jgi:hypothetical protein
MYRGWVGGTRQRGKRTEVPFVPEPRISEVETAIGNLERFKSPRADQIPAELIRTGGGGTAF